MKELVDYIDHHPNFFQLFGTIAGLILTVIIFYVGHRIQRLSILKEYRDPLLQFSNEALDVISELEGLCEVEPKKKEDFFAKKNQLVNSLSSLRDKGKFLMPNKNPESFGTDKKAAYKGIRDESLDCLKSIFYVAITLNYYYKIENKRKINIKRLKQIADKRRDKVKSKKHTNILLGLKILDALSFLPLDWNMQGPKDKNGWSIKDAIIEGKRQFTSLMFIKLNPSEWFKDVKKLAQRK